jgi:hypothetical protein
LAVVVVAPVKTAVVVVVPVDIYQSPTHILVRPRTQSQ